MTLSAQEINELAVYRYQQMLPWRKNWDVLSMIYAGRHADLFPDEFPKGDVAKTAGFIRRSAKLFTRLAAQVPDVYVAPLTETAKGHDDQDRTEKILAGYNSVWALDTKMTPFCLYEVLFGAVAVGVVPDPRTKFPMLLVEDPRNALPGAGWSGTSTSGTGFMGVNPTQFLAQTDMGAGELDDTILRKSMRGGQIRELTGPDAALDKVIPDTVMGRDMNHNVLMYYDRSRCTTVLAGTDIVLWDAPHGAPWCPWFFPTNFAPDMATGDSDYLQQIGLEVAFLRILSQKLALNDSVVFPWLATKGVWEFDPVRRRMQAASPDASVQTISPPPDFQVDKDLSAIDSLLQRFNMETEATQGQLPGGPITGQGIQQLNQAPVVETVQEYFKRNSYYLPRLYATALIQDREVFGSEVKNLGGWARGETFFTTYRPGKDIGQSIGTISTDFGPGLGGYQGHIALLQDLGAESIDKRTVMEHNRNIRSVKTVMARLFMDKVDDLILGSLTGQSAVPVDWLAQLRHAVGAGEEPHEWILSNPPGQSAATPGNTPPVPPEIAAAAAAQGGGPGAPGPGGAPPPGLTGPGPPPTAPGQPTTLGGVGPGPNLWSPPRLSKLVGS